MCTFEIISIFINTVMSSSVNKDIKANYALYEKLLNERKSIFESVVDIKEIYNNANFLQQNVPVQHDLVKNNVELIVVVKVNNYRYFSFKLLCKDLSSTPFFRYDSDGDAHRNYSPDIPLKEQQITTPHFHKFNEKGISFAYKTDIILNESERKALEDINLCIAFFCKESNIEPVKEDYPTIQINSKELPLDFSSIDPLLNVKFQ